LLTLFLSPCASHHPALHSFPTRRSSDLDRVRRDAAAVAVPPGLILVLPPERLGVHRVATDQVRRHPLDDRLHREVRLRELGDRLDRKSTRLNSSHRTISYAVFCLKKKKN